MMNGVNIINIKYGIALVIALVCATFFIACKDPSGYFETDLTDATNPASGSNPARKSYGTISVHIAGQEARTVLPSTAFDKYVYTFTKTGGTATVASPANGYFTLEVGNYTVKVEAYIGTAEPYTLVASGVSPQFTIGSGSNPPVIVKLSEVNTGGQGKFTYTITYPAGATADISLKKWPALNDITLTPLTQGNSKTQTLQLASGSYLLKVLVGKNGLYGGISEALHIYPALLTEYAKYFSDDDLLQGIGAAVSAPTGTSSVTSNSITINAVAAPGNGQTVEYAISAATTAPTSGWQDSTTFSNLEPGTAYYIFARSKENSGYIAGAASAYLSVTTLIGTYWVTNGADSGQGSLRDAIANAASNSTILIESSVGTIQLTSRLSISKSLTIAGNGTTITRNPSWTTIDSNSSLLYISDSSTAVTINRTHFKDGRAYNGAAIYISSGSVNLESCIFSGNQTNVYGTIYNSNNATLSVKGCTFYGNSAGIGGAIYNIGSSGITIIGNLFFGNTYDNRYGYGPVVTNSSGNVTSNGYNVVDTLLGAGNYQSGWVGQSTDKTVRSIPISSVSFKLFFGSGAQNVITGRPEGYPTADFYGNPIPATNAAAGAVQAVASGYIIELSVNDSSMGSAAITSPEPGIEGLYDGSVIIKATPTGLAGYGFQYWLINDNQQNPANPLTISLANNISVQAVFGRNLPGSVQRVLFSGQTETVTLNNLSSKDIYLVKVNASGNIVNAANTGGPSGLSPGIVSASVMPVPNEPIVRMGHPAADEYHANHPPFERRETKRSDGPLGAVYSPVIGDTTLFWVESSYNGGGFVQKPATLVKQGTYGNIWVMNDLATFTATQAQNLASKFDDIYPIETNLLGNDFGNWNIDSKIQILVYDIGYDSVNGITLGYFWGKDMRPDTGSDQRSNQAAMFYINGNLTAQTNYGANAFYSALVHEFQHMIHFVRKSGHSETWYNEMLSMLTEDVISPLIGIGPTNSSHPIQTRIPTFLRNYNLVGITDWVSPVGSIFDSYSMAYAFGAYLLRNYGGAALLKEMFANNSTDIASVTAALKTVNGNGGLSFEEALRRFGEAMIFSRTLPANVQSFDKTVTKTIGSYNYTATKFNVWSDFGTTKPRIFGLTEQLVMRPNSITVHQASDWRGLSGNKTITLQRPNDPNIEFYLLVK